MPTVEYATIVKIIEETGLDPNDVARIEITPGKVVITTWVSLPVEGGTERLIVDGCVALIERMFLIHNPEDHVHVEEE